MQVASGQFHIRFFKPMPTSKSRRNTPPVVGLLTDFGTQDHYVGVMKAAIMSMSRGAQIIDITHDVQPHAIAQGAYLLWASYRYFPKGSVLVAVVDPGVGSDRGIIAAKTDRCTFLAPDNGLLDLVLWQEKLRHVITVSTEKPSVRRLLPKTVSSTFHGRDIFAPLAAHLAEGIRLENLGRKTAVDWIDPPFVKSLSSGSKAKVLHIDRFGNVITNIRADLPAVRNRSLRIRIGNRVVTTRVENYVSMIPQKPCLIVGSSGLVEIAMTQRSAALFLSVDQSDTLRLESQD